MVLRSSDVDKTFYQTFSVSEPNLKEGQGSTSWKRRLTQKQTIDGL